MMMRKTKLVKNLTDKHSIVNSKYYPTANEEANKAEKKKYPKGYEKLKISERKLKPHEVMAKNTPKKVDINKRFKANTKELMYHEQVEKRVYNRLKKK